MRLASLSLLDKPALCGLWQQLSKKEPPPEIRKELMLHIIAHRLQEQEFSGLNEACSRRLRQITNLLAADPNAVVSTQPAFKPGTRLVRQWKEQVHVVEVETEGYEYRGARYESLSEIAGPGLCSSVSKPNHPLNPRRSYDHR